MANAEELKAREAGQELLKHKKPSSTLSKIEQVIGLLKESNYSAIAQPEYQEIFNNKGIAETVDAINEILNTYSDGIEGREIHLNNDIIKLGVLACNLSTHVGAQQGLAGHADQNLKVGSASVYANALRAAQAADIKLPKEDANIIAKLQMINRNELSTSHDTASKVLVSYMFAVKQFIDLLLSVAQRLDRERAMTP